LPSGAFPAPFDPVESAKTCGELERLSTFRQLKMEIQDTNNPPRSITPQAEKKMAADLARLKALVESRAQLR
jgi:hypothetical protein